MKRTIDVNLAGRVAVVTGANTGIGKEIARDLARLNARVILACRSASRGKAAVEEIVADTGNHKTEARVVDLSSRASIDTFARELAAEVGAIHILVNNAGVWQGEKTLSKGGLELTWATNVLGPFALTSALAPLLEAGAKSDPTRTARIVNVASEMAGGLVLSDVELTRRRYDGLAAYRQSKQANRMLTRALARRLEGTRVTANVMHPGWVATELASREKSVKARIADLGAKLFARTPSEGADTASWLAASTEVEGVSGRFYVDRKDRPCRFADVNAEEALWALCERMGETMARGPVRGQSTSSTTLPNPSLPAT